MVACPCYWIVYVSREKHKHAEDMLMSIQHKELHATLALLKVTNEHNAVTASGAKHNSQP